MLTTHLSQSQIGSSVQTKVAETIRSPTSRPCCVFMKQRYLRFLRYLAVCCRRKCSSKGPVTPRQLVAPIISLSLSVGQNIRPVFQAGLTLFIGVTSA
jgi:hypothetical protein